MNKIAAWFVIVISFYLYPGANAQVEDVVSDLYLTADLNTEPYDYKLFIKEKIEEPAIVINGKTYRKILRQEFENSDTILKSYYVYELLDDNEYELLDEGKNKIHSIKLKGEAGQTGFLFGREVSIKREFYNKKIFDPYPNRSQTDIVKFFSVEDSLIYIMYRSDLNVVELFSDGRLFTKRFIGETYKEISSALEKPFIGKPKYNFKHIGDAMQLIHSKEIVHFSFNGTLGNDDISTRTQERKIEEFMVSDMEYTGDTLIMDRTWNKLYYRSMNLKDGEVRSDSTTILINDTMIQIGRDEWAFGMKIFDLPLLYIFRIDHISFPIFGGTYIDDLDGVSYTKSVYSFMGSNVITVWDFFPMPIMEAYGMTSRVSFFKSGDNMYGKRVVIKDND